MVDGVEPLRRRLAIAHVAQLDELFVDQLGFQPGRGQIGLEDDLAEVRGVPGRGSAP